jgi:hypothetical protein
MDEIVQPGLRSLFGELVMPQQHHDWGARKYQVKEHGALVKAQNLPKVKLMNARLSSVAIKSNTLARIKNAKPHRRYDLTLIMASPCSR